MSHPPTIPILSAPRSSRVCCGVFKRVQVAHWPAGGTLIAWELWPTWQPRGPMHFFVDYGEAGTDKWEPVNSIAIVNDCLAVDPLRRLYGHVAGHHYRVRILQPDVVDGTTGLCWSCVSEPERADSLLAKQDWLIARDIARRNYLSQNKRTNVSDRGLLLKRRKWGAPCPRCLDFDTGRPKDPRCPRCYGVGIDGGYFPALDYVVTLGAPWGRALKRDENTGVTNDIARDGWSVNSVFLDTDDIYVRKSNGERFYVREIQTAAEQGGMPVILNLKMKLAPATDPAYLVPLEGGDADELFCGSSSSSSSSSLAPEDACGDETALNNGFDW